MPTFDDYDSMQSQENQDLWSKEDLSVHAPDAAETCCAEAAHTSAQRPLEPTTGNTAALQALFSHHAESLTPATAVTASGTAHEPLRPAGPIGRAVEAPHQPIADGRPNGDGPTVLSSSEVSQRVTDGPYRWPARYTIQKMSDGSMRLVVNAKIVEDGDVTARQVAKVKRETQQAFRQFWDHKFNLVEHGHKHLLGAQIQWVDRGAQMNVALHAGQGRADGSNWFVDGIVNSRAHELGHQIGMKDEYVDPRVPLRATERSLGVYKDHSIMGAYYTEGANRAQVKQRHGDVLARMIAQSTGEQYTAEIIKHKAKKSPSHHQHE